MAQHTRGPFFQRGPCRSLLARRTVSSDNYSRDSSATTYYTSFFSLLLQQKYPGSHLANITPIKIGHLHLTLRSSHHPKPCTRTAPSTESMPVGGNQTLSSKVHHLQNADIALSCTYNARPTAAPLPIREQKLHFWGPFRRTLLTGSRKEPNKSIDRPDTLGRLNLACNMARSISSHYFNAGACGRHQAVSALPTTLPLS